MIIYIDLSKPQSWKPLAWLIMLCEKSSFSHASMRWMSSSLDRNIIYEATGSGVHFISQPNFEVQHQIVKSYKFVISDPAKVKLLQWCIDNCEKPYGRIQFVGLGIKRLLGLFGIKIKNPFASGTNSYICCKLAAVALEEIGASSFDADEIDLNDLQQILEKLSG